MYEDLPGPTPSSSSLDKRSKPNLRPNRDTIFSSQGVHADIITDVINEIGTGRPVREGVEMLFPAKSSWAEHDTTDGD